MPSLQRSLLGGDHRWRALHRRSRIATSHSSSGNDPDDSQPRLTYLKLGQLADAIVDYDAALKVAPKDASSLYGGGVVKLRQGHLEGGNADIATATAIRPTLPMNSRATAWLPGVAEGAPGSATPAESAAKPAGDPVAEGAPGPATPAQSAAKPAGDPVAERRRARRYRLKARHSRLRTARARRLTGRASRDSVARGLRNHLARFPNCEFVTLARLRIDTLKR